MNSCVRALTALLLSSACAGVAAQTAGCDQAEALVRSAYPEAEDPVEGRAEMPAGSMIVLDRNDPLALVCKVWPAHPDLLLAAVPIVADFGDPDAHDGSLEVLVLARDTLDVRARYLVPYLMANDAVKITGVSIDTAAYQVRDGVRAFGVRIGRQGPSSVYPYSDVSLRLFVLNDDKVEQILDGTLMERNGGEWDTRCNGKSEQRRMTLAVGPRQPDGWNALVITERVESFVARATDETAVECEETRTASDRIRHVLRHQYDSYARPERLHSPDSQ